MKVLIGCERSGVVRRAFRELGHDAWSCDYEPADDGSQFHLQGNVMDHLGELFMSKDWDLGIFHPPCTYLCNSGVRWLKNKDGTVNKERHQLMTFGCDLFAFLYSCKIPRVCVENPVMHCYARGYLNQTCRSMSNDARPTQTIQPYEYGHGETKRTCLWLRNLPPLVPTKIVTGRKPTIHFMSPGPERSRLRSVTYEGFARAMAQQWGNLI